MTIKDAQLFYSGFSGVTYTDIANFIGKTFTATQQGVIASFVKSAEDYIARECRKNFFIKDGNDDQVYQETFDGGLEEYILFNYPIKEVTKITVAGEVMYTKGGETNQWTLNDDFHVYPYKVCFENETEEDPNTVVIEYSLKQFWGEDVKLAIIQWIGELMTSNKYAGRTVSSANVNGASFTFDTSRLPTYISNLIARYQKQLI